MSVSPVFDSKQPYTLFKDEALEDFKSPEPFGLSPRQGCQKKFDYSADNSISNQADSPIKMSPGRFSSTKKSHQTSMNLKGRQILFTWSGDLSDSSEDREDEETFTSSTQAVPQKKFVNGLPTVVARRRSTKFHCIKCNYQGPTKVREKLGKGGWVLSTILFITLFWPCLAFVCCSRSCKDCIHECPNCGHVVGKKKFII